MRLAVNYALDRKDINQAACLGFCPPAGVIVPRVMEFALQVEPLPYDPDKAKQLLAEAGYPNGFSYSMPIPDEEFSKELAQVIQSQLRKIGVEVRLELTNPADHSATNAVRAVAVPNGQDRHRHRRQSRTR